MSFEPPRGKMQIFRPGRTEPEPDEEELLVRRNSLLSDIGLIILGIIALILEFLPFYLMIWF